MKKVLSAVLALAMVFSLSCTAFAVEEVPYEPVATEETNIVPKSSLSLSFTSLGSGSRKTSSETYYHPGAGCFFTPHIMHLYGILRKIPFSLAELEWNLRGHS